MSASLQQLLSQQPPTTSGIHEAVALHSEAIFKQFRGILPFFLGKRESGPFINLTLPNSVIQSSDALLQTLSDLIWVYKLKTVSFVSALRVKETEDGEAAMKALLITADSKSAYFQLLWDLDFDEHADITASRRSERDIEVLPKELWSQIFSMKVPADARTLSYDRLAERFGGEEEIPQP
ncbi:hypothetical protein [Pelagicoccus sp. SDUM812003]|uniref:hypothetical protein n=1 Tax=Pelagicoccus sp. SDUM812003 TaxID=3041267 RepID=UPI00280DCCAB|nr:hypothetical protein [Pelagicoccus sp. SDUM812003]MDQ8202448.1 hypothetical protein [Pelagicoccus sp. SDUM812003]